MADWTAISVPKEVYEEAKKYYKDHEEELRMKKGIRSLSAFINYCLREHFKELGIL